MLGNGLQLKTTRHVSLLSVASEVFEKLVNMELLMTHRNVVFFLVSSMVLGLPNQLEIFLQLHLIELLRLLTGLELLKL